MDRNLIVFAGAGASRGVEREKYPTAIDFKNKLPSTVTQDYLYQQIDAYLQQRKQGTSVDIEDVLWEIGRLVEALDEFTQEGNFASRFLKKDVISKATGTHHAGSTTYAQFESMGHVAVSLQNLINKNIYDFYSQQPTKEELERSWMPLLSWAAKDFARVDLTTTNYDLVLENVLRYVPALKVSTGSAQEVLPRIDLSKWDGDGPSDSGLLTKLHGSVDWKHGIGGTADRPVIRHGSPEFEGDHKSRLILYPGFKGRPDRQPFIAFHEYFKQRLSKASHLLLIGFAFRDEYINELLATWLPSTTRVAVIDPAEKLPEGLSFLQRALHLKQGFGEPVRKKTVLTDDGVTPFDLDALISWAQ